MNYLDYCIPPETTVRDAMKKIDAFGNKAPKILFVTADNVLKASITDGDIRRFLLNGGKLEENVIAAAHANPKYAYTMDEAKDLYDTQAIVSVPIVDKSLHICDVYMGTHRKEIALPKLNVPVVINAGGKGTRLEPYTKILPKPLIPVGETPIIEHIMNRFTGYGCDEFHVIVNYKKAIMKAYFSETDMQRNITWYDEEKPLGTGGGLCYLKGKIHKTFFFTNCDNLLLSNYEDILKFHKESKNAITMICAYKHVAIPYGVVDMGPDGTIEAMREKPEFSFLTNTGIYVVEPEVLEDIEDQVSIGFPDIIEMERQKGKKVAVYPVNENEWLDMGQIPELERMRDILESM